MKNLYLLLVVSYLLVSCHSKKETKLIFLDEYIIEDSLVVDNAIVGGLSGVDYANGSYFFIVDDARNPRFIESKIKIDEKKIASIEFIKTTLIKDSTSTFYNTNSLDLESIFLDEETQEITVISEGSIRRNKQPSVFSTTLKGKLKSVYKLPKSFKNNSHIKHNAVFEGSSKAIDKKGFWVSMEGPLTVDGEDPSFQKSSSPIRITYFDKETKTATKQFAYQLEHITKPAKGKVNLNGATAILEYKENHFFIIERTYQSGYGSYGNIVRIFEAIIDNSTTNILNIESLKKTKFTPLKKRLIFNFEDVLDQLTDGIIDNIEGITLGPKLPNGNQSLILVSDDNFQVYGKQLNQFILLEIQNK
mgnify:CR=1 FL=1